MFLVISFFMSFSGYLYQQNFDVCKKSNFKYKECYHHKNMIKLSKKFKYD